MRQPQDHSFAHWQGWQCSGSQDEATSGTRQPRIEQNRTEEHSRMEPVSRSGSGCWIWRRGHSTGLVSADASWPPQTGRRTRGRGRVRYHLLGNAMYYRYTTIDATGCDLEHVPTHQSLAVTVHADLETASTRDPRSHAYDDGTLLLLLRLQVTGAHERPRPINLPKRRAYPALLAAPFSLVRVDPSDWLSFAAAAGRPRPQTLSHITRSRPSQSFDQQLSAAARVSGWRRRKFSFSDAVQWIRCRDCLRNA